MLYCSSLGILEHIWSHVQYVVQYMFDIYYPLLLFVLSLFVFATGQ